MKYLKIISAGAHKSAGPIASGIFAVALCSSVIGCSSVIIEKQYAPDGAVTEIRALEKGVQKFRIVFKYDQAARISTVSKYLTSESKPSGVRSFSYDFQGRLRIQSHRGIHQWDGKTAEDIWVESFFYKNTGELIKTETSYKSSLSIALHKTPLVVTQYFYKEGRIERIIISGGIYRKELTLTYKGKNVSKIDYIRLLFKSGSKKYEPDTHLDLFLKSGEPYKADYRLTGKSAGSKKVAIKIFENAGIAEALKKPEYALNIRELAAGLESEWIQ